MKSLSALAALALSAPAVAAVQPPKLIVAVAVDQFSADLFSEYRAHFTGGLKRLQQGVVFANGYQSHAATETCPGHATILTGGRPARTGIIANNWVDFSAPREDKAIYCAEDESVKGSTHDKYTQSVVHLKVPTLGDRMKAANKASRVVAVAGKDRAAIMMGGKSTDQLWFWNAGKFDTLVGRRKNASADRINGEIAITLAAGLPAPALPDLCRGRIAPVPVSTEKSVGNPLAALAPNTPKGMRTRPELDRATVDLANELTDELKLGRGKATDLLAVSLSVTDYVGHAFGTEGPEMCTQLVALDETLDVLFRHLDGIGVPYVVVLTADHGGHDAAERNQIRGMSDDQRFTEDSGLKALNTALGHADKPVFQTEEGFSGTITGDLYLDPAIRGEERTTLLARAREWLIQRPSFAAVFTRDELLATPPSKLPLEAWTLAERAAASVDRQRSGDLIVLLRPRLSPIMDPAKGSVATHGSPWDYDRRVPILFWSQDMTGFEQPNSIETVDIMPTLAALIDLPVPVSEIDGKCRDLDAGAGSTCPADPAR
jgi:predicted AlkP superfamily pyrophosphatase or phosphodiesterase